jgi:hypothetical protein
MGRAQEIRDDRTHVEPATVNFGPLHAIIDNLRMGTAVHLPSTEARDTR